MKIIERIKIKYYRSFADANVEIHDLTDINIFSWANDSWKSNILRALNLFFNWNRSWFDFEFNRDFSFQQIERAKNIKKVGYEWQKDTHKHIDIEIFFNDPSSITSRPQYFSILKRFNEWWYDKSIYYIPKTEGELLTKRDANNQYVFNQVSFENYLFKELLSDDKILDILNEDWKITLEEKDQKIKDYKDKEYIKFLSFFKFQKTWLHSDRNYFWYSQITKTKHAIDKFLNRFSFEYVPAIKDKEYFSDLFSRTLSLVKEIETKSKKNIISEALTNLSDAFNEWEISSSLDKTHLIGSKFSIPEKLIDFFATFKILTKEDWNKSNVFLDLRWDWIQVQYIPILLNFISEQERERKWASPFTIWWFEEPENSYEYKNIRRIINNFIGVQNEGDSNLINYSKEIQIFITTHSKEILSVQNNVKRKEKISIYRVWRNMDTEFCSIVSRFNDEKEAFDKGIADDLWIINESRIITDLEDKLKMEKRIIHTSKLDLRDKELVIKNISLKYSKLLKEKNFAEEEIEKLSKIIVQCEWKDKSFYENIWDQKIIFKSWADFNKRQIFSSNKERDKSVNLFWLVDQDFLTHLEVESIENCSNIFILKMYCLENYLYHPDNLEEYYLSIWKTFDKENYKNEIINELNSQIDWWGLTQDNIWKWRTDSIPMIEHCLKSWFIKEKSAIGLIYDNLTISENTFELRYKFFSMKTYCKGIWVRQWIEKKELSKTDWFKKQIKWIIKY